MRRFQPKASASGVVLALYAAVLLLGSLELPWWRMESRAPQYGQRVLVVDVSPLTVTGDLKELDGLGHYIGMRSIQSFAPLERSLAPFAMVLVALAALAMPFLRGKKRVMAGVLVAAVPFGFLLDLAFWQKFACTHLDPTASMNMIANRVDSRLLGHYSIAQFHVDATLQSGFWLAAIAAANAVAFLLTERRVEPAKERVRSSSSGHATTAVVTLLTLALLPRSANAATHQVGPRGRYGTIASALEAASPGDEVVVAAGVYHEHLVLDVPIKLQGEPGAILDGDGHDTVVLVKSGPSVVRGLTIRASGDSLLGEDAAIRVDGAPGSLVTQNRISDVLFGILAVSSPRTTISDNYVVGKDLIIPRRGDGIRVFASDDSAVNGNTVEQSRDLSIWNSNHVVAYRNTVRDSRYGLHYMYSDDDVFEDNVFEHNQTGGAIMYSRRLTLRRNRFAGSRGPSAHGLLIKMADDLLVENNWFVDNTRGIFMLETPSALNATCVVRDNVIGGNDRGVTLEPSVSRAVFTENAFLANGVQVEVLGASQANQNRWSLNGRGNYWSDYRGFDLDGDGTGDIEHRVEAFFEHLADRFPDLGMLRMSPAVHAMEMAARAFPIVKPQAALIDDHPLVRPNSMIMSGRVATSSHPSLVLVGAMALAGAGWIAFRARDALGGDAT
jgi:nitrous oxidase accessory protein